MSGWLAARFLRSAWYGAAARSVAAQATDEPLSEGEATEPAIGPRRAVAPFRQRPGTLAPANACREG